MHPSTCWESRCLRRGPIRPHARASVVTSSLCGSPPNRIPQHGYKFGQKKRTYNIVAAHGYFGRLISMYASFNNSRSLPLLAWPTGRGWASGSAALACSFRFNSTASTFNHFRAGSPGRVTKLGRCAQRGGRAIEAMQRSATCTTFPLDWPPAAAPPWPDGTSDRF